MPTLLKKPVQEKYSGKGKKQKGKGKLDFSKTSTFSCLKAAISFKLSDAGEKDISSAIGVWLSQVGDRDGGRKKRSKESDRQTAAQNENGNAVSDAENNAENQNLH